MKGTSPDAERRDLIASLSHRNRQVEMMDDPALDPAEHRRALKGLSLLNRVSRSSCIVWQPIHALGRGLQSDRLRVLDIGSGAGDVLLGLWKLASRCQWKLDLQGIDISDRAIAYAKDRAGRQALGLSTHSSTRWKIHCLWAMTC